MFHLITTLLLFGFFGSTQAEPINAVIGDESFIVTYNTAPTTAIPEDMRIITHLEYVEKLLRSADVRHLQQEQLLKREFLLNKLREYRLRGVFPANYDYTGRRPCFIDKDGNICAVGYLVEVTAGRAAAEAINSKFKYAYIMDINDPKLEGWMKENGLSKLECAMIQPTYDHPVVSQPEPRELPDTTLSYMLDSNMVYEFVEVMPEFEGGMAQLFKFLMDSMNTSEKMAECGDSGSSRAVASFVVNQDGTLDQFEMHRSICQSIDEEIIRVLKLTGGKWTPARQQGQVVKVRMKVPIAFEFR